MKKVQMFIVIALLSVGCSGIKADQTCDSDFVKSKCAEYQACSNSIACSSYIQNSASTSLVDIISCESDFFPSCAKDTNCANICKTEIEYYNHYEKWVASQGPAPSIIPVSAPKEPLS